MAKSTESLAEFYRHKFDKASESMNDHNGSFDVFRIEEIFQKKDSRPNCIRRDFYKIMLYQGENTFHYGNKSIPITGNTLLFFNPNVPYASDPPGGDDKGYFCIFRDEFFKINLRLRLNELPLFSSAAQPVFSLSDQEFLEAKTTFEKIITENNSLYNYRYELIRNYVSELIYNAMKLQPSKDVLKHSDACSRITKVFSDLLERQFPIESISQRFELRSPKAIAEKLCIHVNHLNRSIKKTTGRTTSSQITERLIGEAKGLLIHTDWNIAEISYVLGFEDQAHFNRFFKKNTSESPTSFRQV
ncbi:AraC family transcriptional regulator [Pedobacter sp. G11]|uniref:AraC family transcriptional regulator n=1 Tax=Pedobacter sp. G11 TaxID=2482728 RepID=UPI000F5F239C|nr:helix-turn-helix domain-containing protein [Pedobacter sp. G11]AZI26418.1 AraC family transcriptional regulator [Pedobacter sp. G11]